MIKRETFSSDGNLWDGFLLSVKLLGDFTHTYLCGHKYGSKYHHPLDESNADSLQLWMKLNWVKLVWFHLGKPPIL
jgi:hypothetical protein